MRLSNQQLRVLSYISHGYTNPQIAKALFVSLNTVKTHVRRTIIDMGAVDRAHAVRIGFEEGLLIPADHRRPRTPAARRTTAGSS